MRLIFLGSGSAFTTGDNFHSNMLIESNDKKRLMIDCGSDARHSLSKQGLSSKDIDAVYISHLHADHSGGLEWLAFTRKFSPPFKKPQLFVPNELLEPLWQEQLQASLRPLGEVSASLETFFDVQAVQEEFSWSDIQFELVPTHHIQEAGHWVASYGVFFELARTKILISTDTQFAPREMEQYFKKADLIFHDCETAIPISGVHTSYDQIKTLPQSIKKKTWLYHFNPGALPDAKADGFLGFVKCGQNFEF